MQTSLRLCLLSRTAAATASAATTTTSGSSGAKCKFSTSTVTRNNQDDSSNKSGFFGSLFAPKVEVQQTAHSQSLGSKECLIMLQTHDVKPDHADDYERAHRTLAKFLTEEATLAGRPVGHFEVILGKDDQFVHVWKYEGGNADMDKDLGSLRTSPEYKRLHKEVSKHVVSRSNQVLMPFDFWPMAEDRKTGSHIYEMRSYHLKPGTMIEWGNYWARAIRMRDYKHSEAFLGMFSQIGSLYNVKHIWCYDSLADRKEAREAVWQKQQQQWRRVIEGTMPLIQDMSSKVMVSLDYSPTK